jgi:hypothetical protein
MEKRKVFLIFNTWFPISLRVFEVIFRQNCYSALSISNLFVWVRDRDIIVGIVNRLRTGQQVASRGNWLPSPLCQDQLRHSSSLLFIRHCGAFYPGLKRSGLGLASITEVKNEWNDTSIPPMSSGHE